MNTLNLMTGVNEQYPAARLAYNYQPDTCSGVGFCQKEIGSCPVSAI